MGMLWRGNVVVWECCSVYVGMLWYYMSVGVGVGMLWYGCGNIVVWECCGVGILWCGNVVVWVWEYCGVGMLWYGCDIGQKHTWHSFYQFIEKCCPITIFI